MRKGKEMRTWCGRRRMGKEDKAEEMDKEVEEIENEVREEEMAKEVKEV